MERTDGVRTFVGIDAHSQNCSIKAMTDQGEDLLAIEVKTSPEDLARAVSGLPSPVWAMVESSSMAAFVKESLLGAVDRLIVCETRENRWIAKSEDKSDQLDADRLCRLLRMGEFKEVYLALGHGRDRLETLRLYRKAQGDVTRTKNRIKHKYREHGVKASGAGLYGQQGRGEYLGKVVSVNARFLLTELYRKLDSDESFRDRVCKRLVRLVGREEPCVRLQGIPGVGEIYSSVFVSVIDDPHRFANKRKLWRYAGLGLRKRVSGDLKGRVKGAAGGNRVLKDAALGSATAAIRGDNALSRHYHKMVSEGTDPSMAKRTVARKILATALCMLKQGTVYKEDFETGNDSAE